MAEDRSEMQISSYNPLVEEWVQKITKLQQEQIHVSVVTRAEKQVSRKLARGSNLEEYTGDLENT